MTAPLARAIDAIPYVATTAERNARYPAPSPDFRVQNGESGSIQRWTGAAWVSDAQFAAPPSGVVGSLTEYLARNRVFNVLDYGAFPGPGVDNTATIQAAIAAASAAGGGIVRLPATGSTLGGTHYRITSITVPANVSLIGDNWRGTLLVQSVFNGPAVTVSAGGDFQLLQGFSVYGDRAAQSTANVGLDINITSAPPFTDAALTVRDVLVLECRGHGIRTRGTGARGLRFDRVWSRRNLLDGFLLQSTDSVYSDCIASANDGAGIVAAGNQNKYVGCKAFGNVGDGFADPNGQQLFVGCESQENGGDGYDIAVFTAGQKPSTYSGCTADSNFDRGFAVFGASARGTVLAGCTVSDTAGLVYQHLQGISLDDTAAPVVVSGCSVQAGSVARIGGTLGLHAITADRVTDGPIQTVPAGTGYRVNNVPVVGARRAGWTASTGTAERGAYAAYAAPDIAATYNEAQLQALADGLQALARRVVALEADVTAHGLIGT